MRLGASAVRVACGRGILEVLLNMCQHKVCVPLLKSLAKQRQIDLNLRKFAVHVGDGLRWLIRIVALLLLLGLVFLVVNLEHLTVEEDKHVLDLSLCV